MEELELKELVWSVLEDESDKTAFEMAAMLFPEWIVRKKQQYTGIEGYELYQKIFKDVFEYDINRMSIEPERGTDFAALKIKLMKLNKKLKKDEKKKKGKKK